MENQNLSLSIPNKWQEKFLLKRIDEDDIELSLEERNAILQALNKGARFIQLRKHTLMLNAIKSIDPKWGERNIPPRPKEEWTQTTINGMIATVIIDDKEAKEWDKYFGEKGESYLLSGEVNIF